MNKDGDNRTATGDLGEGQRNTSNIISLMFLLVLFHIWPYMELNNTELTEHVLHHVGVFCCFFNCLTTEELLSYASFFSLSPNIHVFVLFV